MMNTFEVSRIWDASEEDWRRITSAAELPGLDQNSYAALVPLLGALYSIQQ
jgi:hypothetical protein